METFRRANKGRTLAGGTLRAQDPVAAAFRQLACMPGPRLGLTILLLVAAAALFAPWITPHHPTLDASVMDALMPPGKRFLLGTDHAGRDVLSRLIHGARISLTVGLVVQGTAVVVGAALGLLAGYYGGWVDEVISALITILQAFPGILFAMAVMAVLGPGLFNVFVALGLMSWPTIARLVRGEVLALRERDFVEAAWALGASDMRILFRHILPNCSGPIIVSASLGMASAILSEASLSFLGLGAQPPTPSWGAMLAQGRDYLWQAPWLTLCPGLAIFVTILALNLVGDGLRDVLDPRLRD